MDGHAAWDSAGWWELKLTASDLEEFRVRFYDFNDGVVCGVELAMQSTPRTCRIRIESQDRDADSGWSYVCFEIRDVQEFRFAFGRTTFEVLSSGIQFAWRDGRVYVVLDAYPDDGPDLPDLAMNTAYVAGLSCDWSVSPYIPAE